MEVPFDDATLARLREHVHELHRHDGGPVPHASIVALARTLGPQAQVTLDFAASALVGVPLLVVRPAAPVSTRLPQLSAREKEVAGLLATGMTNKAIAKQLALSPATVKDHIHRILQKTGLPSRAAVVAHLAR